MANRRYDPEFIEWVASEIEEAHYGDFGDLSKTAARFGLRRGQLQALIANYPEISEPYNEARERLADWCEATAFKNAVGVESGRSGHIAVKVLQQLRPERWKSPDRVETEERGYRAPKPEEKDAVADGATLTVVKPDFERAGSGDE
jgi:hypothetical protein